MTLTDRIVALTGREDIRAEIDALVKATKVFVMSTGSYSDTQDVAVFTSLEGAQAAKKDWDSVTRRDINDPEEFLLDSIEPCDGRSCWTVEFEDNGDIKQVEHDEYQTSDNILGRPTYQTWGRGGGEATVWAKDAEMAKKIACDLRAAELYRMALEAQLKKD